MPDRVDVLVVGAGPTGLGAAWRLDELGHRDWRLCEAERVAGGLAGSVVDDDGFTWDLGSHVRFSHYPYFDELMDDLLGPRGWLEHERRAVVRMGDRLVPYPFQLNVHRLPAAERAECLAGLAARPPAPAPPKNLDQWIEQRFGAGIARLFLRPYNRKVWGHPLELLDWRWTDERVAAVGAGAARAGARPGRDDTAWGPNRRFRYPRRGGTGAVWAALAGRLAARHPGRLRFGWRLARLDTARRLACFAGGEAVRYERLLTTVPLDALVRLSDLADALAPALPGLRRATTHVIGVAVRGRPPADLAATSWMYLPGGECWFHRLAMLSRYSPANVPDARRHWSLLLEATETAHRPAEADPARACVDGLLRAGLLRDPAQVHHVWHRRLPHGYPVPTLDRDGALARIGPALEARAVYSRGRFGAWRYEVSNQDHSFAQGVEVVDRWLTGAPEPTLGSAGVD